MTTMLQVTYIHFTYTDTYGQKNGRPPIWDRPHNIISSNQLLDEDILKLVCRSDRSSSDILESNLNL